MTPTNGSSLSTTPTAPPALQPPNPQYKIRAEKNGKVAVYLNNKQIGSFRKMDHAEWFADRLRALDTFIYQKNGAQVYFALNVPGDTARLYKGDQKIYEHKGQHAWEKGKQKLLEEINQVKAAYQQVVPSDTLSHPLPVGSIDVKYPKSHSGWCQIGQGIRNAKKNWTPKEARQLTHVGLPKLQKFCDKHGITVNAQYHHPICEFEPREAPPPTPPVISSRPAPAQNPPPASSLTEAPAEDRWRGVRDRFKVTGRTGTVLGPNEHLYSVQAINTLEDDDLGACAIGQGILNIAHGRDEKVVWDAMEIPANQPKIPDYVNPYDRYDWETEQWYRGEKLLTE